MRESTEQALSRWKKLETLQAHYRQFRPFLEDCMEMLGFEATEVQEDIADFIAHGPKQLMVQAQRGQAKTTIVAIFAVFALLHSPSLRVLIVSGGENLANQISKLVVQIIMHWDILECMRPNPSAGDRISVEAFDIHHSLKGMDKSPSIACVGITGNFTGFRSDLLLADDVETPKNSYTATMREQILERTREFSDLCKGGRIIYLGTPQTSESIYNSLPARGFTVRIWPGRYPTPEQMKAYGDNLAPMVLNRIANDPTVQTGGGMLGDQGKALDERIDEKMLQDAELDGGTPRFQLQYMLNTELSDKNRYPLKAHNLVLLRTDPMSNAFPMALSRDPRDSSTHSVIIHGSQFKIGLPVNVSEEFKPLQSKIMYVDPAAGGKTSEDETGYCVLGFLNGNVYLLEVGGIPGGYDLTKMEQLADIALKHKVERVIIEKNMGWGGFREVFIPVLYTKHKCGTDDAVVSGQKEKRIVNILGPVIGRGSFIILQSAIESDEETIKKYEAGKRKIYSFMFQLTHVNETKNCLIHDDRLDAVAGAVNHFIAHMAIDQRKKLEAQEKADFNAWLKNPVGYPDTRPRRGHGNIIDRYRR